MNTADKPTIRSLIFRSILIGAFLIMTLNNIAEGDTLFAAGGVGLVGWYTYVVHRDYNLLKEKQ